MESIAHAMVECLFENVPWLLENERWYFLLLPPAFVRSELCGLKWLDTIWSQDGERNSFQGSLSCQATQN